MSMPVEQDIFTGSSEPQRSYHGSGFRIQVEPCARAFNSFSSPSSGVLQRDISSLSKDFFFIFLKTSFQKISQLPCKLFCKRLC
uniref:Uncharacterized protein n=1 Tax=Otus sunia TaxID=257818 RepID=A0A8C8BDV1_9STRI